MKEFKTGFTKNSISDTSQTKKRKRKSKMSKSEVMTIMVIFHLKSYRNLKHFYLYYVCKHMNDFFPNLVSYNRFVELQKKGIQPLTVYLKLHGLGKCSGISFIDSTALKVSHYKREKQHKVFKGITEKSYGTLGWFYGFKLHLTCNDRVQIIDFLITKVNIDDRYTLKNKKFYDKVFGKIYVDKGFDSKKFRRVIHRRNMFANIVENKRNRKGKKRGRKRFFNQYIYDQRFFNERTFAWLDSFRTLLIRFDSLDSSWLSWHYLAFALILLKVKMSSIYKQVYL
ncbi:IS982 family transposase [Tenacibaculum tangerinum]|uniref:IS982 family transposase n=1 Tax=Tenacibaculum tangerinum TaxID=3038772 RepID=A0ABY8L343_9FLAO|nr:IS982 family transposase [Tenacibaculum tangerinum]WGH75849.1 IS982 family transposase [Tenacibaculum tangerinum]